VACRFATKCATVNFVKAWMSSHLSSLVWPCDQNVPRKIGVASPAGYTHGKAAQMSSKDQMARLQHISDLAWSRLGLSQQKCLRLLYDREVFRLLLGLLFFPSFLKFLSFLIALTRMECNRFQSLTLESGNSRILSKTRRWNY